MSATPIPQGVVYDPVTDQTYGTQPFRISSTSGGIIVDGVAGDISPADTDAVPQSTESQAVRAFLYAFDNDTGDFDRVRSSSLFNSDFSFAAVGAATVRSPFMGARLHGDAGTNAGGTSRIYRNVGVQSLDNADNFLQQKALLTTPPAQWSLFNSPADNANAVATRVAQGADTLNIVNSITISLSAHVAASGLVIATLNDGANDVWGASLVAPNGENSSITISDLAIPASAANTAMTLTVLAGGATTRVTASMSGITVS